MIGKNSSLCGGLELPVADRNAQGQQTWMQMNRSTVSELVPRTLKARLDVFAVLFDLIVGWFDLPVDRCQACKPHLGILKKMVGFKIPWPKDVERPVNGPLVV